MHIRHVDMHFKCILLPNKLHRDRHSTVPLSNNQLNWTSQIRNVMEEINIFVILQFVINNTQKKKDRSNVETA